MAQHLSSCDVAIVGAGIMGLAHAYLAAKSGAKVAVCERHPRARGASVRNFGMIWPIGQPSGARYKLACRSREIWIEVLRASGLWHDPCGSLHLAYHPDEVRVLREFEQSSGPEFGAAILNAAEIRERFPAVRPEGLQAGLFSSREMTIDPREAVAKLPGWLAERYGVAFHFGCPAVDCTTGMLTTAQGELAAEQIVLCTGDDFETLFPQIARSAGLYRCKLQMMRSQPLERVGVMLAAGLTLQHYPAFGACPTLPDLKARFERDMPEYGHYGIHVLASQTAAGELTLGDSHEYGDAIDIFDKPAIDELVLRYLRTFLDIPRLEIRSRWHGVYAKHPTKTYLVEKPLPGITAVVGLGGNGMTLSFGVAETVIQELDV